MNDNLFTPRNVTLACENIYKMFEDRGYTTKKKPFTLKHAQKAFDEQDDIFDSLTELRQIIKFTRGDEKIKVLVEWFSQKITVPAVRNVASLIEEHNCDVVVVVSKDDITNAVSVQISSLQSVKGVRIECWKISHLIIRAVDHEYVPVHRILPPEEVKELLKSYKFTRQEAKEKFPKIKKNDPIMKHYAAKIGNIVEITRKSQACSEGTSISYRYVIA